MGTTSGIVGICRLVRSFEFDPIVNIERIRITSNQLRNRKNRI